MNRRKLLMAAGVVPVAALTPLAALPASPEATQIQSLYVDWLALTKEYFAIDAKCNRGEIDDTRFMELADPVLDRRFDFEDQIAAWDSQTPEDLAIKAIISAHYDWGDTEMQESLSADAARFLNLTPTPNTEKPI